MNSNHHRFTELFLQLGHSHTQEKGYGAPAKKKATENKSAPEQTENAEKSAKPNAANDRSKHYHPRDGK